METTETAAAMSSSATATWCPPWSSWSTSMKREMASSRSRPRKGSEATAAAAARRSGPAHRRLVRNFRKTAGKSEGIWTRRGRRRRRGEEEERPRVRARLGVDKGRGSRWRRGPRGGEELVLRPAFGEGAVTKDDGWVPLDRERGEGWDGCAARRARGW